MYESHFGFHRQPFQCAELARAFFVSESIGAILPQLLHALRSDLGIAVLTGPAGVGKSSLLKHLQSLLSNDGRSIICSGAALETPSDVLWTLQTVARQKSGEKVPATSADGQSPPTRWAVVEMLRKTTEFWGPVLLLIDDAQLLPVQILNELRAFTEEEWNGRGLVRILVSGPHSFEEDLARQTHTDFSRRIRCHAFLQPLSTKESIEFLSRHLEAAGGRLRDVFHPEAIDLITSACDGLPRCLSLLADESLVVAAELSRKSADEDCIRKALKRLQHLPYSWNASPLRRDENTFAEDNEFPGTLSAGTAVYSPVTTLSAGVVEFGAPGVIEFGANTTVPDISSSMIESDVIESDMIESDVAEPAAPVESVWPSAGETETPEPSDLLESDAAFEVGYCFVDESQSSWEPDSSAISMIHAASQSTSGTIMSCASESDGEEAKAVEMSLIEASNSTEPGSGSICVDGDTNWLPVFDRYTWISLGRNVAPGLAMLSSVRPMQRLRDWPEYTDTCRVVGLMDSLRGSPTRMNSVARTIPVTQTSDPEIIALLTGPAGVDESGTFLLPPARPVTAPATVVISTKQDTALEEPEHALVDASVSVSESDPEWHDGQLLFTSTMSGPENSTAVDTDSGEAAPSTETEQISFRFDTTRLTREAPEKSQHALLKTDANLEKFFTLPLNVNSVVWHHQPESADPDSVLPLAESLAALRDEVASFQQTGRNIPDNEFGVLAETSESPSPGSPRSGGSLVARAKQRLGEMAQQPSIRTAVSDETRAAASDIIQSPRVSAVEELPVDASGMNETSPKFGQLFTRLRQMRRRTAENDFR